MQQRVAPPEGCVATCCDGLPHFLRLGASEHPWSFYSVSNDTMLFSTASLPVGEWLFSRIVTIFSLLCCPSSPESLWSPAVSIRAVVSALALAIPTVAGVCCTTREYSLLSPRCDHLPPLLSHPISFLHSLFSLSLTLSFLHPLYLLPSFVLSDFTLSCSFLIRNAW